MDATATARVPAEIKHQVDAKLRAMGASPTTLINAAYEYVLEMGELPKAPVQPPTKQATSFRVLAPEQQQKLRDDLEVIALQAPASWEDRSFEEIRESMREDRYARFA